MKSDTSPARRTLANRALFILTVLCGLFLAGVSHAANVTATFNSAADIPVTANGYTATGNTLDVTLNFTPTPGTNLTVVRNTALTFINGTFDNVANGATLNLTYNGTTYPFVAWYYGGAGRDLVLLWPYTGIAAWGYNNYGELGDNTTQGRSAPSSVEQTGELNGKTIVQLARGGLHTLALTSEEKVYSWGYNGIGQLGDYTNTDRRVPVAVNTADGTSALFGKTVIAISAGGNHNLALCSDGTVAAWGYNVYGQLGDNSTVQSNTPRAVDTAVETSALFGKTVVAIAAGSAHSLALCSDGTLTAWGANSGQIGDNSTTQRNAPVVVNTGSGISALYGKTVTAIAAGNAHSLALCSDGTLATWGANLYGEVGDNTTTPRNVPTAVSTTSGTSALSGKSAVAIAAGSNHSLAFCSDGTLVAWGVNGLGQLGDNTTASRLAPVAVNTTSGTSALYGKTVTAISTGALHSLALCSDGTITAWGYNAQGQLGDTTSTQRIAPVAVNTASGISSLAGKTVSSLGTGNPNSYHSIAIFGARPPEIEVEVLEPSTVSLNDNTGIVDYGTVLGGVRTFRVRNTGELPLAGISATMTGTDAVDFMVVSQPASMISGGSFTTIQVLFFPGNAGVKSSSLQIASNDSDENPFRTTLTGTKSTSTTLFAAYNTASDVPLAVFGLNATGLTLNLSLNFAPTPGTNLTVVRNFAKSFIDGQFDNVVNGATVNLTYNGITYPFVAWYYGGDGNDLVLLWPYTGLAAWGYNEYGQVGDNTTSNRLVPSSVDQTGALLGKTIVQVARGGSHTLALTSEGKIYAWGDNFNGQLGSNTVIGSSAPIAVNTTNGTSALFGKTVIAIAAGSDHSLALCSDGTVAAWGDNTYSQLGDNMAADRTVPVAVNTTSGTSALFGKTVISIAAGIFHSLALCSDGTLVSWGFNNQGAIGDGTTSVRSVPVSVNTTNGTSALFGKTVTAISTGYYHSLALCSDGTVAAWGNNQDGQVGDNTTANRTVPVSVNTTNGTSALFGKTVTSVVASDRRTHALCSDGTVLAWGFNTNGQLGDNTTAQRNSPVAVNAASGTSALFGKTITSIAAASAHSTALCTDGTLVAWGLNTSGQLGDNTTTQRNTPRRREHRRRHQRPCHPHRERNRKPRFRCKPLHRHLRTACASEHHPRRDQHHLWWTPFFGQR